MSSAPDQGGSADRGGDRGAENIAGRGGGAGASRSETGGVREADENDSARGGSQTNGGENPAEGGSQTNGGADPGGAPWETGGADAGAGGAWEPGGTDTGAGGARETGGTDARLGGAGGGAPSESGLGTGGAEYHFCNTDEECGLGMLCDKYCTPCPEISTTCPPGTRMTKSERNGCTIVGCESVPCSATSECDPGSICYKQSCQACATVSDGTQLPCPSPWQLVQITRNGCRRYECVPPKGCTASKDCATDEICQPGIQCQPGGESNPLYCWGNHCEPTGCSQLQKQIDSQDGSCSLLGCADGQYCANMCPSAYCKCVPPGPWVCTGICGQCTFW